MGSVQEAIDKGLAQDEKGVHATQKYCSNPTLLDTIEENKFDAAMGGARRDEEKARAKERFFSHIVMTLVNGIQKINDQNYGIFLTVRKKFGEHFSVFPISNWTEMDIWQYIKKENIDLPSLYFSHEREVVRRGNTIWQTHLI